MTLIPVWVLLGSCVVVMAVKADDRFPRISTSAQEDLVTYLPGIAKQPEFRHYSGYLSGTTENTQHHYWLVEAEEFPEKKPLILWLNGGPGCSSLLGLMTENGPFLVQRDGLLDYNPYSWNRFANVLYLESPGGVGFSYVKDGNLTTDDDMTSLTNYHAMLSFMEKFPKYKGRDFYITGESYAGVYVPLLAVRFLENNFKDLNLKGIAVGNGVPNRIFKENAMLYFNYYHGLLDESLWDDLLASCCTDQCANKCMFTENKSVQCMNVVAAVVSATDGLNAYNIYAPCDGGVRSSSGRSFRPVSESQYLFNDNIFLKQKRKMQQFSSRFVTSCIDDTNLLVYFNNPKVRQALHVDLIEVPFWDTCNQFVTDTYGHIHKALQPQYLNILEHKVRTLLYVGDVDGDCTFLEHLWFVEDLELKMPEPLKQWLYLENDGTKQVGGVQKVLYHNDTPLWYVTVRGSGHMVPHDKPVQAFHILTRFIQGLPL
ncbi:Lysosomal protective protein [Clonorchis sinensis]|uniref:Carboxypeptidase n=1 Tax=Clonorchis sinensis TaxID=79923 RepID=A0A3R7ERW6_CLOSI|nr:Lysosomal protective protein [Clonorchis sinensis]